MLGVLSLRPIYSSRLTLPHLNSELPSQCVIPSVWFPNLYNKAFGATDCPIIILGTDSAVHSPLRP